MKQPTAEHFLSNYMFGDFSKHKRLTGPQRGIGMNALGIAVSSHIQGLVEYGTPKEKKLFKNVKSVSDVQFWIRVDFNAGTSLKDKKMIRNWLQKHYNYKDKPYVWTKNIFKGTSYVAIGPWSAKPWIKSNNKYLVKNVWVDTTK